jgi:ribosomal protein L21E
MYGREAREPSDMMPPTRLRTVTDENMIQSQMWHDAIEFVKDKIKEAQESQKQYYDKSTRLTAYEIGDRVMLKEMANVPGKFNMRWEGPYIVTEKKGDVTYKIQSEETKKFLVVHVDRMKKFHRQPTLATSNEPIITTDNNPKDVTEIPKSVEPKRRKKRAEKQPIDKTPNYNFRRTIKPPKRYLD